MKDDENFVLILRLWGFPNSKKYDMLSMGFSGDHSLSPDRSGKEPMSMDQELLRAYQEGSAIRAYEFLGCHPEDRAGVPGFVFRVWAPNAQGVNVVGDFNFWNADDLPMDRLGGGIWEAWSPNPREGVSLA